MQEDQRIVLTRENIYDELNPKTSFWEIVTIAIVFLVLYFMFGLIQPIKIYLRIFLVTAYILGTIITIRERLLLKDGIFSVTEDKIISVSKKRVDIKSYLFRLGDRYVVTFENFGTSLISKRDLGRYAIGDKYCLVSIKPFLKRKLIKYYSLNKYNYVGIKKKWSILFITYI